MGGGAEVEGKNPEASSPLSVEPSAGLDPRTLRSSPDPKARVGRPTDSPSRRPSSSQFTDAETEAQRS